MATPSVKEVLREAKRNKIDEAIIQAIQDNSKVARLQQILQEDGGNDEKIAKKHN